MLKGLIEDVLPGLSGDVVKKLLQELEDVAEGIAVNEGAKLVARGLVKGIDAFAAVAVKHLAPSDTEALTKAYVATLATQMDQLSQAARLYVPLALDVEINKERFGKNSTEANAARKRREVGITEMRQEVKDLLLAATGDEPVD